VDCAVEVVLSLAGPDVGDQYRGAAETGPLWLMVQGRRLGVTLRGLLVVFVAELRAYMGVVVMLAVYCCGEDAA